MTDSTTAPCGSLIDRIRQGVEGGEIMLAPLPELAQRLRDAVADERTDAKVIAHLVETDQALAASLLRIANSAMYGGLQTVSNLGQAVSRIGMRQVSSVATALLHKGHFATHDPARAELLRKLWEHAVATALAARCLATMVRSDREEAFLGGLLHDLGKLVALKGLDQLEASREVEVQTPEVVRGLMDSLHCELGHRVLRSWKVSDAICKVALHHHDADPPAGDTLVPRIQAANALAAKLGASLTPQPDLDLREVPAIERLNLKEIEMASLLVNLEDDLAEVRDCSRTRAPTGALPGASRYPERR